jgi:phosphoesterase RecJ-like protein
MIYSGCKYNIFILPVSGVGQLLYLCALFFRSLKNTDISVLKRLPELFSETDGPVAVVPHSNPDGDAIGSAFGLARVLKNYGRKVKVVTPNDFPEFLNWSPGDIEILNFLKNKRKAENFLKSCSILVFVDFNEPGRLDEVEKILSSVKGKRILIDHHPHPVDFCDLTISEPSYSSTAQLVYEVIVALNWQHLLDKSAAEALYLGIMTDTGSFSYGTSNPGMYDALSALVRFGIDTERIHSLVYDNFSAGRFRLMGYCLYHKMVIIPEFRTAYISLTANELKMFNFVPGDTEGFVNLPLSVRDVVFSALFIEKEKNVKASFRSRGKFPVNSFSAAHFNGGGHLNAAGGDSSLPLEKVIDYFTQLLPDYQHLLLDT